MRKNETVPITFCKEHFERATLYCVLQLTLTHFGKRTNPTMKAF